jgi:2-polyprenyl-3-methyl-5-hydroxy-6-metoxy-1,4-benzoquinol methylase
MFNNTFAELEEICKRPAPFEHYTAADLWTDEHTAKQMLTYHLNESVDVSSRRIEFINKSVEWIASHFNVSSATNIADFGCGPGLYSIRLARKDANVTAIDFSLNSIEYARKTAKTEEVPVEYVCQNYLEYNTNMRFDIIIMIMCDFCALSPEQRRLLLTKFRTLLQPGGAILFDVYTINAFASREEESLFEENLLNGFWSPQRYYGFLNTFKYEDDRVVLDKYSIFQPNRTRFIYNWLQYFGEDELSLELADCGLGVEEIYANVAGASYDAKGNEMAIVAKALE